MGGGVGRCGGDLYAAYPVGVRDEPRGGAGFGGERDVPPDYGRGIEHGFRYLDETFGAQQLVRLRIRYPDVGRLRRVARKTVFGSLPRRHAVCGLGGER